MPHREGTAVLDYPDPLEALATCHEVATELELDPALVEAIHAHLLAMDGRPPAKDLLAAYVTGLVARVDEGTLRERLRLPPLTQRVEAGRVAGLTAPTRHRGRPKGTRTASRQQIVDAYHSLTERTGKPPTQAQLAINLDPPVAPRTLQAWLREYGLPWPIE
jgi:hypothetical protein